MMVLAALGAMLQAGGLCAQKSDNTGFMVGLHAVPMGLDGVGTEAFEEEGMGLGLTLGYGFSEHIALYTTVDAGYVEYDPDNPLARGEDYESVTVDLGARVSFGGVYRRVRPYVDAAITGVATSEDAESGTSITSGGGVTVGGGLQYFYTRGWALNAGVQLTSGAFTEMEVDGRREEFESGDAFVHTRVQLGVVWHP
jgi:hypothetical protein